MTEQARPLRDHELMSCIEEGLNKFGPGIKYAVMWRMVLQGKAPKEGILANLDGFVKALGMFGNSGKLIEKQIVDLIKARAEATNLETDSLTDLIRMVRSQGIPDVSRSESAVMSSYFNLPGANKVPSVSMSLQ